MASVHHLEFEKKIDLVKYPSSERKFASAHQIWSKWDNSWLKYSDKTIFKMAAVRHLAFAKLPFLSRDLYLRVILHLRSEFRINRPICRRDIAKKTIFNMASVRHLEFVMTSSYYIRKLHFTFPTLCWIFTAFGFVISKISCISCFSILAWNNCLFRA